MNSDEFKDIFETINDISLFLSLTNGDNLIDTDIEKVFFKCHYTEQFINLLKTRNFICTFESKLKEYCTMKGRVVCSTVPVMEYCLDEALTKILTLQTSSHLIGTGVKLYLTFCSYQRFEDLIKKLAEFRSLYVDVSHQLKEILLISNIEHIVLAECWLKIINSGEEGLGAVGLIINKMFLEPESIKTLIKILCINGSEYVELQNAIVNKITSEHCDKPHLSSWKQILESELLELLLSKFSSLLETVLSIIELFGNEIIYNSDSKNWELSVLNDFDHEDFIRIFKKLSDLKAVHYKLKRIVYINKIRSNLQIWEHIEKYVFSK